MIVDHFSKWVEIFPLLNITAETVANNVVEYICRHGVPDSILTDKATNFQSELLAEIWELLDVRKLRTSPYYPQCDGITERFNRTLKSMIASFVKDDQSNWDEKLIMLAFAYNSSKHATTKCSPFEIIYGRLPKMPLDLICPRIELELYFPPEAYALKLREDLKKACEQIIQRRDLVMDKAKVRCDRQVRAAQFKIGDLVWKLDLTTEVGKNKKLSRKWLGPFEVVDVFTQGSNVVIKGLKKGSQHKTS